jgi:hypothetical protein
VIRVLDGCARTARPPGRRSVGPCAGAPAGAARARRPEGGRQPPPHGGACHAEQLGEGEGGHDRGARGGPAGPGRAESRRAAAHGGGGWDGVGGHGGAAAASGSGAKPPVCCAGAVARGSERVARCRAACACTGAVATAAWMGGIRLRARACRESPGICAAPHSPRARKCTRVLTLHARAHLLRAIPPNLRGSPHARKAEQSRGGGPSGRQTTCCTPYC